MSIKKEMLNYLRGRKRVLTFFIKQQRYSLENADTRTQIEASITRLYHTIEKGLSYIEYRPGFGKSSILDLINLLAMYSDKYGTDSFTYSTALSCLNEYMKKNHEYGYTDEELEDKIKSLLGEPNQYGGILPFNPLTKEQLSNASFRTVIETRHSIRHFSNKEVPNDLLIEAICMAQKAPSACNRQPWRTIIVEDKIKIRDILSNQNGNRGFGHEINKLLIVLSDLQCYNKSREFFQVFIDGGIYSGILIEGLHFLGVGSIPLSAALTQNQENKIRTILGINQSEQFILLIGVGFYPDAEECITTKSTRKKPYISIQ